MIHGSARRPVILLGWRADCYAARPNRRTFFCMNAGQAVIVVGGSLLLLTAMIAAMFWATERERRHMERRREEWVARGSIPEEEPTFYTGSGGSSGFMS